MSGKKGGGVEIEREGVKVEGDERGSNLTFDSLRIF